MGEKKKSLKGQIKPALPRVFVYSLILIIVVSYHFNVFTYLIFDFNYVLFVPIGIWSFLLYLYKFKGLTGKTFTRLTTYTLIFFFLIFYQIYWSGERGIIFAATCESGTCVGYEVCYEMNCGNLLCCTHCADAGFPNCNWDQPHGGEKCHDYDPDQCVGLKMCDGLACSGYYCEGLYGCSCDHSCGGCESAGDCDDCGDGTCASDQLNVGGTCNSGCTCDTGSCTCSMSACDANCDDAGDCNGCGKGGCVAYKNMAGATCTSGCDCTGGSCSCSEGCGATCDNNEDCNNECSGKQWYSSYSCNLATDCECNLGGLTCDTGHCSAACNQGTEQTGGTPNYCQACSDDANCQWNNQNEGLQCNCAGDNTKITCSSGACSGSTTTCDSTDCSASANCDEQTIQDYCPSQGTWCDGTCQEIDRDTSQTGCTDSGGNCNAYNWNSTAWQYESGTPSCCGDDASEYYEYCQDDGSISWSCSASNEACCDTTNDCVDSGDNTCKAIGVHDVAASSGTDDYAYCFDVTSYGQWRDCDDGYEASCGGTACPGGSVPCGETGFGECTVLGENDCCGDDSGELYEQCSKDAAISWSCSASNEACCDTTNDCVDSGDNTCKAAGSCYDVAASSGTDDYAYCNDAGTYGQWLDPDDDSGNCTASGCSFNWNSTSREYESGEPSCCGDDASEYRVNKSCVPGVCTSDDTDWCCGTVLERCSDDAQCYSDDTLHDVNDDGWNERCAASSLGEWEDGAAPRYSYNNTNDTEILTTEAILIYANWTDNVDLNYSWLWTNETGGTGQNWSGYYDSPYDINLSAGETWSNFTWQNTSIEADTVIAWKIYANDSAGNENVTAQGYFTVKIPDATFAVAMPASYSFKTIDSENEASATETAPNNMSFNFTDIPEYWVEPCAGVDCASNKQGGISKPIYFIDATGNAAIDIGIRLNESLPSGLTMCGNASCTGSCNPTSTCTAISTSYVQLIEALSYEEPNRANITLYANLTGPVTPGEKGYEILINASYQVVIEENPIFNVILFNGLVLNDNWKYHYNGYNCYNGWYKWR